MLSTRILEKNIAKIKTIAFCGIDPIEIIVEVHVGSGLPSFTIVGLPDKSISEAKDRIRSAFNVVGLALPCCRITVNMSPASLQKEGSHYDLAIAIGILVATNIIPQDALSDALVIGELGLDGSLQAVPGALVAAMFAVEYKYTLLCPLKSANQARIIGDQLNLVEIDNILDVILYIKGESVQKKIDKVDIEELRYDFDMSDVKGQAIAKRGLEIAACGDLHVLMIGPPGVGKSMLARRMITILPDLTPKECLEVTAIYSVASKLDNNFFKRQRPFRDPHHSATMQAMVGGGSKALPGEVSLAHNGVLFLDELGQYYKALEGLRECMETGKITIARAQSHVTYPAKMQIIAAMNPCKCGYYGTINECAKAPKCAENYMNRISGPILDRFDIVIHMDEFNPFQDDAAAGETSVMIRERVLAARAFQMEVFKKGIGEMFEEGEMRLADKAVKFLSEFCNKHHSSRRAYMKIAKIARLLANIEQSVEVSDLHMARATLFKRKLY